MRQAHPRSDLYTWNGGSRSMQVLDLTGRVAVVTGGSRGIGWAISEVLAQAGAAVAIVYRDNEDAAEEATQTLRGGGANAIAVKCDIADDPAVVAAIQEVLDRLGRIDILVNNAGIWRRAPIVEITAADLDEMLRVNLGGLFHVTREAVKDMLTREWGRVINVSSTAGVRGEPFHSHYAATKGALFALSRSLAGELSPSGITVNTVSPGWVFTDMTSEALTPEKIHELERSLPTGRLTHPADVANAVLFLASPLASQITGANIDVNGGSVFS
jgi:3-oxoacyl-[acyl-carrier protein] reductase